MTASTAPLGWALCFCTDGRHAAHDAQTPDRDRDRVERNRHYSPAGASHLVRVTEHREVVPFTDDEAALRAAEIADWAASTNRLPADVELPCGHRLEDACDACADIDDIPGSRTTHARRAS